jgi:hypothetical protein
VNLRKPSVKIPKTRSTKSLCQQGFKPEAKKSTQRKYKKNLQLRDFAYIIQEAQKKQTNEFTVAFY